MTRDQDHGPLGSRDLFFFVSCHSPSAPSALLASGFLRGEHTDITHYCDSIVMGCAYAGTAMFVTHWTLPRLPYTMHGSRLFFISLWTGRDGT
ncbi:hypothetical protein V8F33_001541 [Rhypophila sp. PSN 637]